MCKMRKTISVCFLATAVCACIGGGGTAQHGSEGQDSIRVEWDSVTFHEIHRPMGDGDDKPSCAIDVCVETAVGHTKADSCISRTIAAAVLGDSLRLTPAAVHHFADSVKNGYTEEMSTLYDPDDEYTFRYQYVFDVKGARMPNSKDGVTAYKASVRVYQGGAHDGYAEVCVNMDARTGRELLSSDVFGEDKTARVKELIERQLMDDNGAETMEQLRDSTGITMLGEVYVSDFNFLLLKDGVHFIFNPYDIAPWATGLVEVKLTYRQLEGCLK